MRVNIRVLICDFLELYLFCVEIHKRSRLGRLFGSHFHLFGSHFHLYEEVVVGTLHFGLRIRCC